MDDTTQKAVYFTEAQVKVLAAALLDRRDTTDAQQKARLTSEIADMLALFAGEQFARLLYDLNKEAQDG